MKTPAERPSDTQACEMEFKEDSREEAVTSAPDFLSRRASLLCALLLAVMAAQMLSVIARKNITVDEWVMIPAGYYHLTEGDYRPVNEHPPFAKVLAAAPLLVTGLNPPPVIKPGGHEYEYFLGLFEHFWNRNVARFDYLTFWARVPAILVTVLLGTLVFIFARRYWGPRAALFAVALFSLEPTVLAHGRVVQTDIPSALALLIFSFAFYAYLKAPTTRRAVYVGLAAGLAAVTKFSMITVAPVLCVVFAVRFTGAKRRGLTRKAIVADACALAFAAVLAVNAAYFFHHRTPEPLDEAINHSVVQQTASIAHSAPAAAAYYALQVIFPADFISGIGWQLAHTHNGHNAGLLGQYRDHGWWYYFPVAFALKTPLPILLLSIASLVWAALRLRREGDRTMLVLLVPVGLFTLLLMMSTINIGVRYYLPAYPFFFILSGVMLDDLLRRSGRRLAIASAVVAALFCWVAVEAVRAYPDHMTYMNQIAGRAPHWWYLSDSNVEWGDDIRDLATYLHERGERRVGAALLDGPVLDLYGVEGVEVFVPPGQTPEDVRYVAIGASLLNGSVVPGQFDNGVELTEDERVNYFDRFRHLTPEKIFGGSIYLYRMRE